MYNLFNLTAPANMASYVPGQWRHVRNGLRSNISKIITFYRNHAMAVPSNHYLVRLLQSIGVPRSQPLYRYADNVDIASGKYSMALGMTSSINQGKPHHGIFYGPRIPEIIIHDDAPFDPEWADSNWMNLCPVKVIHHPISNLGFLLPNGKDVNSEEGFAVISINISMLAIMYRRFRAEEAAYAAMSGDGQRSVMQFVHMFVLPNMLFSHADYVLFNRIYNTVIGKPMGESYGRHSFHLIDYTNELRKTDTTLLDIVSKSNKNMTAILRAFPVLYATNFDKLLEVPDIAMTRQVYWAMIMSRLDAVDFMVSVSRQGIKTTNRQEVNKLFQMVRKLHRDNVLRSAVGSVLANEVLEKISTIVEKINS